MNDKMGCIVVKNAKIWSDVFWSSGFLITISGCHFYTGLVPGSKNLSRNCHSLEIRNCHTPKAQYFGRGHFNSFNYCRLQWNSSVNWRHIWCQSIGCPVAKLSQQLSWQHIVSSSDHYFKDVNGGRPVYIQINGL